MKRPFASVGIRQADIAPEVRARFAAKIKFGATEHCWPWLGSRTEQGYGRFRLNGAATTAQRVAYAIYCGDLEPGLTIDHHCGTPSCVNPSHLEAVPHSVNVLRSNGICAQYARRTHCPRCGTEYALYDGPNHQQRYCPTCKRNNGREWMRRYRAQQREAA